MEELKTPTHYDIRIILHRNNSKLESPTIHIKYEELEPIKKAIEYYFNGKASYLYLNMGSIEVYLGKAERENICVDIDYIKTYKYET